MIAVDTNVLVRLLVDEPSQPEQVRIARALVSSAQTVYVPLVVLIETTWVLESSYRVAKPDICAALDHLSRNTAYQLEAESEVVWATEQYRHASADFSDCVILAGCKALDVTLYSFDKKLCQLEGASPPA